MAQTKKKKLSSRQRQNQIIGYVVMGFGVLAVLAVGAMAVSRYTGGDVTRKGFTQHLTPDMLEGDWVVDFLDYHAIFQTRGDTYQIFAVRSVKNALRYYSRGHYVLQDSMLLLSPDKTMGNPADDDPKNKYRELATKPFIVELRIRDGKQIWFSGPVDPKFPHRNPAHPLLQFSGSNSLVWRRK